MELKYEGEYRFVNKDKKTKYDKYIMTEKVVSFQGENTYEEEIISLKKINNNEISIEYAEEYDVVYLVVSEPTSGKLKGKKYVEIPFYLETIGDRLLKKEK